MLYPRPPPEEAALMVKCVKCLLLVLIHETLSAGRVGRICKLCYNSSRALADFFKKRNRKHEWDSMNAEKKRKLIVENKCTGGRGKTRELKFTEEVQG